MNELLAIAELTTEEIAGVAARQPSAILLPVGSVEPHGPHLPLGTDTLLSEEAAKRAAVALRAEGVAAWVAPSVPYGVTDFAAGFSGAIGVGGSVLTAFLGAIAARFVADGWAHVCLVNNHLEPAHDQAVRAAVAGLEAGRASVACPLTKRWGRILSDEFKRAECHAGRYETSLVLAAGRGARPARAPPRARREPLGRDPRREDDGPRDGPRPRLHRGAGGGDARRGGRALRSARGDDRNRGARRRSQQAMKR